VASLRDLLEHAAAPAAIGHRSVPATPAAAISEDIGVGDALLWYRGALGELRATLAAQGLRADGPAGGMFADELFADEHGRATIFTPCHGRVRPWAASPRRRCPPPNWPPSPTPARTTKSTARTGPSPPTSPNTKLALDGPLREYYLVGPGDTLDEGAWRTEIGWPVFATGTTD